MIGIMYAHFCFIVLAWVGVDLFLSVFELKWKFPIHRQLLSTLLVIVAALFWCDFTLEQELLYREQLNKLLGLKH